jgi:hypothetical protein
MSCCLADMVDTAAPAPTRSFLSFMLRGSAPFAAHISHPWPALTLEHRLEQRVTFWKLGLEGGNVPHHRSPRQYTLSLKQ